jgi:hypothetical protein
MYRLLGMLLGMKVLSCRRPKHNLGFELGFESELAGARLESNKTPAIWTRNVWTRAVERIHLKIRPEIQNLGNSSSMKGPFAFNVPLLRILNSDQMLSGASAVLEMHACLHLLALLWNSGVGNGSCTWEGHATGRLETNPVSGDGNTCTSLPP